MNWIVGQLFLFPLLDLGDRWAFVGGTYVTELLDQVFVLLRTHCRPVSCKIVWALTSLGGTLFAFLKTKIATAAGRRPLWRSTNHETALTAKLGLRR